MLSDLNGHTARALHCKKATVMLGSTTSRAVSLAAAPSYLQKQSGRIGRAVWLRCKANTLGDDQTILSRGNLFSRPYAREGADGQAVVCPLLPGSSQTRGVAPKQHRGTPR